MPLLGRVVVATSAVLLLASVRAQPQAGAAWPMFGRAAEHGAASPYTGPVQNVHARWRFQTRGIVHSSPVVGAGGDVFVGSYDGHVYALGNASGTLLWSFDAGVPVIATPALAAVPGVRGAVLVGAASELLALDAASGAVAWRFAAGGDVGPAAIGTDGAVYFGAADARVYKLTAAGELVWTAATGGAMTTAPALSGAVVFVGGSDANLTCLAAHDGARLWTFSTGAAPCRGSPVTQCGGPASPPAISADGALVYVASFNGNVYAVDAASGAAAWGTNESYIDIVGAPALDGRTGAVLVGTRSGVLKALDGRTGAQRWAAPLGNYVWASAALGADGTVYVGADDGNVTALAAASGALLWRYPTGGMVRASPALGADGALFVGSYDGAVYALAGAAAPQPPPPAPQPLPPPPCADDWDCTLSGACVAGACVCDKPWSGPSCAELRLAPAPPVAQVPFIPPGYPAHSTWGCAPFPHPDGARTCFYYDWVVGNWSNDEQIAPWDDMRQGSLGLACAADALGPYELLDPVAVPFRRDAFDAGFLQNSLMVQLAAGAGWLLVYTTAPAAIPRNMFNWEGSGGEQYVGIAWAQSPLGPWTRSNHTVLVPAFDGYEQAVANNPALVQLDGGGFSLVFRQGKDYGLAACFLPTWDGVCQRQAVNGFAAENRWHQTEDPFSYRSPRGGYIMISHRIWGYETLNAEGYKGGGTKAVSRDGLVWTWAGDHAYSYDFTFTNGTSKLFVRREEPKLLFGAGGRPTHLFNAVTEHYLGGVGRIIVQALDYS